MSQKRWFMTHRKAFLREGMEKGVLLLFVFGVALLGHGVIQQLGFPQVTVPLFQLFENVIGNVSSQT
jgi:hypothetical protein